MRPLVPLVLSLSACAPDGDGDLSDDTATEPELLELTSRKSPVDLGDTEASFYEDVSYDAAKRTRLDLFVPDGDGPFPLVIEIHGGGFTGGDKEDIYRYPGSDELIANYLDAGVAWANVEYRLLQQSDDRGVIQSLEDTRRALQFLRWHHEELSIDPTNVLIGGTSAGAGAALWLGTHDDMADPTSDDPVLRQTTRIQGVLAYETQATYDLVRWETEIFVDYGITLDTAVAFGLEQVLLDFYGIESTDEIYEEPMISYRADIDMLGLMTADDPPILVNNAYEEDTVPLGAGPLFHHPNHAVAVREEGLAAGIDVVASIPKKGIEDEEAGDVPGWVRVVLGL